jgi:exodeoxyribonuclease V
MIKYHLVKVMLKYLAFAPTSDQHKLLEALASFVSTQGAMELLIIKGYAGTGKTLMISTFVKAMKEMNIKTVLLAPTGRAAKVLASYADTTATTIHKKIYRQKSSKDAFGTFILDRNLNSYTFFIVDEASMLSDQHTDTSIFGTGNLLKDLISYVYNDKNCKLIMVGDTAQLPPVGLPLSKAMEKEFLEMFNLRVNVCELHEIVRQEQESGILFNATAIRNLIGKDNPGYPKLSAHNYKDIQRIAGNEVLENITNSYQGYGQDETMVICRSNKIANNYNQGIRNRILFREEELSAGDSLMVVKNNYFWMANDNNDVNFIANGDIVKIKRIKKYQEMYGFRFADAEIIMPDYNNMELSVKLLVNTLYSEAPALTTEENKQLFFTIAEDFNDIKSLKKRYTNVKENPYFNALQVKYAYAITCHKSQGGQWRTVFIDQSYFRDEMLTPEYLKWLYTAFTRATEKVFLVNFNENFF